MTPPADLRRTLGLVPATAMVAGIIIGASIFVQPSVISQRVPTAGGITAVWLVAGLLTLLGALVAAELASAFPRTGGVYVFLAEAWGPAAGFLWGWAMLWIMHSGIVAAIAVVCARYVGHLVPLGDGATRLVAMAAVLLLTLVNAAGVRLGGRLQTGLTALKVGAVALLVALLFTAAPPAVSTAAPAAAAGPGDLLLAVGAGLFAFGGWHMVTYAAGETVAAERTIPRALLLGTLVVTACYVGLNAAYLRVLPLEAVRASRGVAADAAGAVFGARAASLVAALVVLSTLGALNGVILAGPRVYFAMAQDRLLFRWLGAAHPRFGTPARALALQGAWAAALIATGTYDQLFGRVIYTEWIFFAVMALGLLRLRGRPAYRPAWRLPLAPVTARLFAAAALAVAMNQVAAAPRDSLVGLAVVASGLPVHLVWQRLRDTGRTA